MIKFLLALIVSINPNIEDDILEYKTPEQAPEVEELIKELGGSNFGEREVAALKLRKLDVRACIALAAHHNDPDPEIRSRTRLLLKEMRYVWPKERVFPNIWELPNILRFPKGYEQDVEKTYYDLMWFETYENAPNVTYAYDEIARFATIRYIGDLRVSGLSKEYAIELMSKMAWNHKHLYHVDMARDYDHKSPPSCLLTRPVKEGVFWEEMPFQSPHMQMEMAFPFSLFIFKK